MKLKDIIKKLIHFGDNKDGGNANGKVPDEKPAPPPVPGGKK